MPLEKPPLRDRAEGRWQTILSCLGVPDAMLRTNKHHPCPWCGGRDRFRFTDKDGSGLFYCGQCGSHTAFDYLMHVHGWDFARAAKEIESVLGVAPVRHRQANVGAQRSAMKSAWEAAAPIEFGGFVDKWFSNRGIRQDAYPTCLRQVSRAEHVDENGVKSWHPVMLAKIAAPDDVATNLHRTYLTVDGRKAPVDQVRKVMPGGIATGSAIRLFPAGEVLGVAEGIETAFAAAALFDVPVWSTINSTMLKGWEPPAGVEHVIVFGDNDPKHGGQAAAYALAHRLSCLAGRSIGVRVEIPSRPGTDWNDVLLQRSVAA